MKKQNVGYLKCHILTDEPNKLSQEGGQATRKMCEGVLQTGVRGGHHGGAEGLHDDQDDVLGFDSDVIFDPDKSALHCIAI